MSGGKSSVFMTHDCCWMRLWWRTPAYICHVRHVMSHFQVPVPQTRPVGELGKCQGIDFMAVVGVVTKL